MNILLLAPHPFFQDRGTPIAVKLLLEVLSEQGFKIRVLTYAEGENVEIANCTITRLPAIPCIKNVKPGPSWKKILYDLLMLSEARKIVRLHRFDLIHAVEESTFIAINLKKRFGIPFIYDMDSFLSKQIVDKYGFSRFLLPIFKNLEKKAVKYSIGVLAVCKSIEDAVRKYDPNKLIQSLEDISLLPSGPMYFIDKDKKIKTNGPVIMYVGNLEKYQGIDLLLESFKIASKALPDTHLMIIGGAEKHIKFYKKRALKLDIVEKTAFIGPCSISELPIYFAQADILVSPRTRGYNTPMKIYSYLDSGKAVLATRLPAHTQVLNDEIAHLVESDRQSMASGMIELLKNSKLRIRLAAQAKKRVKEEYSFEAYQRKLSSFYKAIDRKLQKKSPLESSE